MRWPSGAQKAWLLVGTGMWLASLAFHFPVSLILIIAGFAMTRLSLPPGSRRISFSRWDVLLIAIAVSLAAGAASTEGIARKILGGAFVVALLAWILPALWEFVKVMLEAHAAVRQIRRELSELDPSRR